ncbi:MAG: 6-methylsalicylate decarboxylase [Alphaproteobacteria bacterium]|jgi:predicted TIM-barrel fold metal-dependent hydrolase|nr:6-methylsalicylate decarboxylase [Alphaproteobacteria bacterium]
MPDARKPRRLFGRCVCCVPPSPPAVRAIDRRTLLAGALATSGVAAAAALPVPRLAQAQPAQRRIDFHHHQTPPAFIAAMKRRNMINPSAFAWTPERSLEEMDKAAVGVALLSVARPELAFFEDSDEARAVARESNDYGAKLQSDYKTRFGVLASLPLPHVDESLKEIEHAFDVLKVDGVCLMTSYGDKWLGHTSFAPVMDALNARKAIVFVHPIAPNCCAGLKPVPDFADSVIEYGTDTTRTIASILFSGTSRRCKDIRFVFAHGGGTAPYLVERFNRAGSNKSLAEYTYDVVMSELRRYHYDTAIMAHPAPLAALTRLAPITQILFGSDYPFRTPADTAKGIGEFLSAADLAAVERGNALRLIPRLASL